MGKQAFEKIAPSCTKAKPSQAHLQQYVKCQPLLKRRYQQYELRRWDKLNWNASTLENVGFRETKKPDEIVRIV